jgi:hypothetical protein
MIYLYDSVSPDCYLYSLAINILILHVSQPIIYPKENNKKNQLIKYFNYSTVYKVLFSQSMHMNSDISCRLTERKFMKRVQMNIRLTKKKVAIL